MSITKKYQALLKLRFSIRVAAGKPHARKHPEDVHPQLTLH